MGVSNKTWSTDAYGTVVFHLTLCSYATGQCKAWIFTFLVYACKMRRTVGVNQALWLRSWKGKYHASKESLNLMCWTLTVPNRLCFWCDIFSWQRWGEGCCQVCFCCTLIGVHTLRLVFSMTRVQFYLSSTLFIIHLACTVFWVDLRGVHLVCGEPIYPFGQVHTGLWLTTLQLALGAQGLSTAHGLMHFLFLQDV